MHLMGTYTMDMAFEQYSHFILLNVNFIDDASIHFYGGFTHRTHQGGNGLRHLQHLHGH